MATHERVCDTGNLFQMGSQLVGSQGTVEADAEQLAMANRVPKRLRGLPGKSSAARVSDGSRNHDRRCQSPLVQELGDRE